jgi:DNA-binding winged helix-turn-helix (wHTH) protein
LSTPRIRFGAFEFDPLTRELRLDGNLVRLQAQPSQVLAALLASPGEVVSRESLRQLVWGRETHVDFENGLNFCVAQIRSALGDAAESPLYIRSVPKQWLPVHRPSDRGR